MGRGRNAAGRRGGQEDAKFAAGGPAAGKLYADCLQAQFGRRPVVFYTNGYEHWLWDDGAGYPPREVARFYQVRAIKAIGAAFDQRQREALLAMATGAGNTRRGRVATLCYSDLTAQPQEFRECCGELREHRAASRPCAQRYRGLMNLYRPASALERAS